MKYSGSNWHKAWRLKHPGLKACHRCCKEIPLEGPSKCAPCKEITNANYRRWYRIEENTKRRNEKDKRWARKAREDVINGYGGKCNHCGEINPLVLQLDHINNDGAQDRRENNGTAQIYRKVRKLGYPKDSYQLLCANCNWCKGIYGVYPDGSKP